MQRAVRSVLAQEFARVELIIVDDGSTDNTASVVSEIQDSRIYYVHYKRNRGIGAARHAGIKRAKGEFIAFIDSDDVWLPGKLLHQLRLFRIYPHLDLIFGNFININHMENTHELGFKQTARSLDSLVKRQLELGVWEILSGFPQGILKSNFVSPPTVMFRAEIIGIVGNFNQALSGPEDFEFWWRAAVHGKRFAYTERPLIERHKDAQSISAQFIRFAPQYLRALDICEETALNLGEHALLPSLRSAKHRTWRGLIRAYAMSGERRKAITCFLQSFRYGISRQALVYAVAALAGPRAIAVGKRLRDTLAQSEQAG